MESAKIETLEQKVSALEKEIVFIKSEHEKEISEIKNNFNAELNEVYFHLYFDFTSSQVKDLFHLFKLFSGGFISVELKDNLIAKDEREIIVVQQNNKNIDDALLLILLKSPMIEKLYTEIISPLPKLKYIEGDGALLMGYVLLKKEIINSEVFFDKFISAFNNNKNNKVFNFGASERLVLQSSSEMELYILHLIPLLKNVNHLIINNNKSNNNNNKNNNNNYYLTDIKFLTRLEKIQIISIFDDGENIKNFSPFLEMKSLKEINHIKNHSAYKSVEKKLKKSDVKINS